MLTFDIILKTESSTSALEIWVPAVVSLAVSLVALFGSLRAVRNANKANREDGASARQEERRSEHARWVRDRKIDLYADLASYMTDANDYLGRANEVGRGRLGGNSVGPAPEAGERLSSRIARMKMLGGTHVAIAVEAWLLPHTTLRMAMVRVHGTLTDANEAGLEPPPWPEDFRTRLDECHALTTEAIATMQADLGIPPVVLPEERQEER